MEHEEFLRTISEVAITLSGFIGIVAALKIESSDWSARTVMQFSTLLRASISACLLSFMPYLLYQFIGIEELTWSLSALVLVAVMAFNIVLFLRDTRDVKLAKIQFGLLLGGIAVMFAVFLSVFDVFRASNLFLFGLVWQIMVGVNNFAQLLMSDVRNIDQIKNIQS